MSDDSTTTVVGAFQDINSARMTIDELHMAGFDEDEVRLVINEITTGERLGFGTVDASEGSRHEGVRGFLTRLIGLDYFAPALPALAHHDLHIVDQETERYVGSLHHAGHHLVVICSGDELSEAVNIMRRNGAEIEGRVGPWLERQRERLATTPPPAPQRPPQNGPRSVPIEPHP